VNAEVLDEVLGGWLRELADAGGLDGPLTAIAIDGKWLRGVLDGQVKPFVVMLHQGKVIISERRIPDETTETAQVRKPLEPVGLRNAVVTADATRACRDTPEYIAGKEEDGGRESQCLLWTIILSFRASRGCDPPRPLVGRLADGTVAALLRLSQPP
jgi:hypothetical protein